MGTFTRQAGAPAGLVAVVALIVGLLGAGADHAAAAGCFGKQATMTGSAKRDVIRGTGRADVIASLGGSDIAVGRGGKDRICLGGGNDQARGQGGKDRVKGGGGDDLVSGDGGKDLVLGGGGFDLVYGGGGRDKLKAGGGIVDLLFGNGGNDRLIGGGGQDISLGGPGNDVHDGGPEPFDVASFFFSPAPVTGNLGTGIVTGEGTDTLRNVEGLEGSPHDDTLMGGGANDFFWDTLGNDVMDGLGGIDGVSFYTSQAPVTANVTTDVASGQGSDSIPNIEWLAGSFNSGDVLTGDAGPNDLVGLDGDDSLNGAEGDDLLDGGNGNDTGDGGADSDRCVSIEAPANCEVLARTAGARSRAVAAPPQSLVFR